MRISFKRNGFIALASMLSFAVYAGDNLPLATAASGTNGSIQVSEHGVDTSNEIQQARVIQGTVLEEGTNEPLIGVNVVVKGTTIGTTTDVEGKYSIRIPSDNAVLVFSYIGQKTEEYSVKGLKSLDVIMKSDATMLSEVVVYTGYMTQKKADLTGSVALADSKDIKKTSANVMKAMQGKMAGVKISNNGGNPAEDIGIQIRGLSSLSGAVTPLIVLDGMPAEGLNLRDINSGDIESIQVLKDAASASIYGARASGGVILVQTKKGKAGKTTIDYNGSVSVSSIINRPEMMNATEWGTAAFRAAAYDEWAYGSGLLLPNGFEYEYHRGDNGMLVLDNMKMKEYLDNNQLVKATDTNWMDEIFRTAVSTNHQLTISNGSDKAKSLFSLGYTNNQGTQIHSFFKQYSVRANTEYSLIKDRLKVGENLAISYLQYKSQWETFLAMIMPPMVPVYDVNGNWAGPAGLDDFDNPVRKMTMGKDNINNYVKIIGNVFADLNIWNGISARTQFGINYGNSYSRTVDGAYVETGFRGNDKNYVRNNQSHPIDAVPMGGVGYKVNPVGLICSTFRPSDDATIFPFLVPSNFFAVASLRQASEMVQKITKDNVLADELLALSKEVYNALQTYAVVNHPKFGKIYAFEIDGFGSAYLSDDANVPNLLALPYLGGVDSDDAIYANTRRFVWSEYNPYFFKGSYFEGIGGHHIGTDMIWPMSLIMKALTAQDDKELQQCIQMLQKTHAGTGFMHESFHKDDPKKFTRSWFAWANTLFGELLWKTFNEKPYLLEY